MDALPPEVPYVAPAPECRVLTPEQAGLAYGRLQRSLASTEFDGFRPSEVCGLVQVRLRNGSTAYTDATGRFLLLALTLDTHKGAPADQDDSPESDALSAQLQSLIAERAVNPQAADEGMLMTPAISPSPK